MQILDEETKFVTECYLKFLERKPDLEGFDHYVDLLKTKVLTKDKLVEVFKNSSEYQRKIRRKEAGKKYELGTNFYGKIWVGQDDSWYSNNFIRHIVFHAHFIEWLKQRKDVNTILEVGCGTGNYPIRLEWLFENKNYLGTDISESAIEYCKKNSKFEFFAGDFLKMNLEKKFDLVYSHSVIDHVYDIDLFLSKIIKNCKKYAFISSYQGYFPNSKQHEMNYHENDGYYLNKLSVSAIRETLLKNGLEENEFSISPFEGGLNDFKVETIIEIKKTCS